MSSSASEMLICTCKCIRTCTCTCVHIEVIYSNIHNVFSDFDYLNLRRLLRCSDMIRKAATKLLTSSQHNSDVTSDSDQSEGSSGRGSVASRDDDVTWSHGVRVAEQEVQFALETLSVLVRREMRGGCGSNSPQNKLKEPASPHKRAQPSKPVRHRANRNENGSDVSDVAALRRKFDAHRLQTQ